MNTKIINLNNPKRILLMIILFFIASCREESPNEPNDDTNEFKIESSELTVIAGRTQKFFAKAILEDGTESDVTGSTIWSVSPGNVGSIDQNGLFTSTGGLTGEEVIEAAFRSNNASVVVKIVARPVAFAIYPALVNIQAGKAIQFKAFSTFENGETRRVTDNVKWSVSPPGVTVSINANGKLTTQPGSGGIKTVSATFLERDSSSEIEVQSNYRSRFETVVIPAGSFIMGDNAGNYDFEGPEHQVFVDAFEIGKYEITNTQFVQFLNDAQARGDLDLSIGGEVIFALKGPFRSIPYTDFNGDRDLGGAVFINSFVTESETEYEVVPGFENHPVLRMTWYGAAAFCQFYGYRLPTEAEWEMACRGGQQFDFGTNDGSISHGLANYWTGFRDTTDMFLSFAPVGSFPPNPFGLFDMSGNVLEFVFDLFDKNYYSQSPANNPLGPEPHTRAGLLLAASTLRSGSWGSFASQVRCSSRFGFGGKNITDTPFLSSAGIRVARTIQ